MSLGWTNRMSSIRSSSLRSTANTKPSKSLRVTRRYLRSLTSFSLLHVVSGWDGSNIVHPQDMAAPKKGTDGAPAGPVGSAGQRLPQPFHELACHTGIAEQGQVPQAVNHMAAGAGKVEATRRVLMHPQGTVQGDQPIAHQTLGHRFVAGRQGGRHREAFHPGRQGQRGALVGAAAEAVTALPVGIEHMAVAQVGDARTAQL